jgi:DNA-binding NtrC family response regulator
MTQRTLLIIEPDEAIAHLFAEVLEEGYAVARASGPRDAVRQLWACGRERFDLVLSAPCTNPYVAPYAWLDHLRTCTTAPIVICSRWPGTAFADHRTRGFAAVLAEPCDLDDLIALVASLCTGREKHAHRKGGDRRSRWTPSRAGRRLDVSPPPPTERLCVTLPGHPVGPNRPGYHRGSHTAVFVSSRRDLMKEEINGQNDG